MTVTVIAAAPQWFDMTDPKNPKYVIGRGREISTERMLARANIFEFEGRRADLVHRHELAAEIYCVMEDSCPVEAWVDGKKFWLEPGHRMVIWPGSWHATRPAENDVRNSHILVVAAPAFSEDDQEFMAEQPDGWLDI